MVLAESRILLRQRMYRRRHGEFAVDMGCISKGIIWDCDTALAPNPPLSMYIFREDQFVHDGER